MEWFIHFLKGAGQCRFTFKLVETCLFLQSKQNENYKKLFVSQRSTLTPTPLIVTPNHSKINRDETFRTVTYRRFLNCEYI